MAIHRHAAIGMLDIARGKIERIDVGDASGAIDDAVGLCGVLDAFVDEDHAQAAIGRLDPFDADTRS